MTILKLLDSFSRILYEEYYHGKVQRPIIDHCTIAPLTITHIGIKGEKKEKYKKIKKIKIDTNLNTLCKGNPGNYCITILIAYHHIISYVLLC